MDFHEKSIAELKTLLAEAGKSQLKTLADTLIDDGRAGARALAASAQARLKKIRREEARLRRLIRYEEDLFKKGYRLIAGTDEVGRGALAGPLVAAAVILPFRARISGIDDSKKLAPWQREELAAEVKTTAVSWAVAEVSQEEIDDIGLQAANLAVLGRAVAALSTEPDFIICDGFKINCSGIPSMALVKGDSLSQTVAAASILAKVHRDALMVEWHRAHPAYGFDINKGYGTADHISAIKKTGPCPVHRRSFFPISDLGLDQLGLFSVD